MTNYEARFFDAAAHRAERMRATGGLNIVAISHFLFRNTREFWPGLPPGIENDAEFRTGLIKALKLRKRGVTYTF